jgi:hypothetical protein
MVQRRITTLLDSLTKTAMLEAPAAPAAVGCVEGAFAESTSRSSNSAFVSELSVNAVPWTEGEMTVFSPE